jgi:hypothetical protein
MGIRRCIRFGALLVALLASRAYGQTTFATLTGLVTDSAGGVVPGAVVEARHILSNYTYTRTTNKVGHYTFGQLREGEYVLRVQISGFKEFVAQNISSPRRICGASTSGSKSALSKLQSRSPRAPR